MIVDAKKKQRYSLRYSNINACPTENELPFPEISIIGNDNTVNTGLTYLLQTISPESRVSQCHVSDSGALTVGEHTQLVIAVSDTAVVPLKLISALLKTRCEQPGIMAVLLYNGQLELKKMLQPGLVCLNLRAPLRELSRTLARVLANPLSYRPDPFLASVTTRQQEIMFFLSRGVCITRIACYLDISVKTVSSHCIQLRKRFGVMNSCGLHIVFAELSSAVQSGYLRYV